MRRREGLALTRLATARPAGPLPIGVLGELRVGPADAPLALPASRKTRALLAYLVVTARPHQRSELSALFWEDAADPRAALRWSLTQLRRALGDAHRDLIVADRQSVEPARQPFRQRPGPARCADPLFITRGTRRTRRTA